MTHNPSTTSAPTSDDTHAAARLSTVDRFLPLWIGLAMAAGLLLGRLIPALANWLNAISIHGTSLPIAIGLLLMMYPVLAKVRYREIGRITADRRMIAVSLILNWIIGPAVMFALAWLLLPDLPAYRTGVILVGLARCIAMVLIWTDLACGDREMAAVLVALNAVFQVLAYAGLGVFYLNVLPAWLHLPTQSLHVSFAAIAVTVVVFLGIPLVAGYLTRTLGERARGQQWYESTLLPRIAPDRLVRTAVHCRRPLCPARQNDHVPAAERGPDRAAIARLLRRDVDRWVCRRPMAAPLLRPNGRPRFLRGQQRLRAGNRRRHRRIRRHLRTSPSRSCRPAHRGARAARARLRGPVAAPADDVAAKAGSMKAVALHIACRGYQRGAPRAALIGPNDMPSRSDGESSSGSPSSPTARDRRVVAWVKSLPRYTTSLSWRQDVDT